MKRTFLCLGVASMLMFACQSDDRPPTPNEREDILLTRSELEMTARGNGFAFEFFKIITVNEGKENVFVSPLSASVALSMTANGAAGTTLDEMKTTLGFKDYAQDEINAYYKKLISGLLTVDRTVTLNIANAIWINKDFTVKQPFVNVNKEMYDAEVTTLDFNSPKAVEAINQWCSDKTNKRITNILDKIDSNGRLYLTNALYFKGIWTSKFDKRNTISADFMATSGQTGKVDMMRQQCNMPYTSDEGLQIVELPYGNEAFGMVILLPEAGQSIDNTIDRLNSENWEQWMARLSTRTINIELPRFKLEYDRKLNDDLIAMGMSEPFCENADFSKMSDSDLLIGLVKQITFVEVNEEGTEAAAVTIVGMLETALPEPQVIPFHVNRPFVYVIKEKSTGAILFMGKMGSI